MKTAFPLSWPIGWQREARRINAGNKFSGNTFARARDSLGHELELMGAEGIVLSSNVPLRFDGQPRGGFIDVLADPGIAIYFTLKGKPYVMARDVYTKASDNLRSIGLAVEHLRGLHRHGGASMMERAFTGFAAIEAPRTRTWREVLGCDGDGWNQAEIRARFMDRARQLHPDVGGTDAQMAELNAARDAALKEISAT